jgi:iron-sulfur cluster repair protein YtfE (RIC family)
MTTTEITRSRVDLFSDIHKGLRKALFDLSVQAGAIDFAQPEELAHLAAAWGSVAAFLRCHTEHEDDYIFRLLDGTAGARLLPDEDHRDLDDLLDDLDGRLGALTAVPDPAAAVEWYRDLNRYIAATLQHLHLEETVILPALWEVRSDEELSACRSAFLAATPPAVTATTMDLLRAALPQATLRQLGLLGR